jgi:hypothetical protein
MPFTARIFPSPDFLLKGSLVDSLVRSSNEHIPIVRVPRAGGRPGCPSHPFEAARCASTEDHQEDDQAGHSRLAVSSVPLLEWMTLRGSHALLDSPIPSLPRAMRRDVQRWSKYRCNNHNRTS